VPVEVVAKELLTEGDRLCRVELIQAVGEPGFLPCFDNDGGEVFAELVGVDLESAMLGALEGEGKG
jgi:hypothetical protein